MEKIDRKFNTINIVTYINELIVQTEITQYFKNTGHNSIELQMVIPKLSNNNLTRFEMTMRNQKVISKLIENGKAKEKYTDTISSGNTGFISYSSREETTICLGNIPPNEEIELKTYFFGHIISKDYSYQASFPVIFPGFLLIDPENFYDDSEKYEYEKQIVKGKIYINTLSKLTRLVIKGSKNFGKIEKKYSEDYKRAEIDIYKYNFSEKDIPGIILFRTEEINKDKLFFQYDQDKEQYYYILHKTLEIPKFKIITKGSIDEDETINYTDLLETNDNEENINNKVCLIFLLDQSGSMDGIPIELCKKALLILLQSLNKGSYFQLIGFGTDFQYYSEEPLEYDKENIKNLMNIIRKLTANKGGTELFTPLKKIYNDILYEKYEMTKHIIVLTDGAIVQKEETLNLIGSYSDKFYFHSIGIGNCDKDLIERSALVGNGYSYFIDNLKNLNKVIISLLEQTQSQLIIKCESAQINDNIEDSKQKCIKINDFFRHGIISDHDINNINFKIEYNENEILVNNIDIEKMPNGEELGKLIVDNYLKNNKSLDFLTKIKLSKKYNILCSETSFYAEIQNEVPVKEKMITISNENKKAINNNNNISMQSEDINTDSKYIGIDSSFRKVTKQKNKKGIFSWISSLCSCKKEKNKIINKKVYTKIEEEKISEPKIEKKSKYPKIILPKRKQEDSDDSEDSDDDKAKSKKAKWTCYSMKKCKTNDDDIDYKIKINEKDLIFDEIVLGQDILEGNWKKDTQNEKLIEEEKDLYEKIKKYSENKGINDEDGIITLFILYYIFNKKKEKVEELKFIIKKAKNFIKKVYNLEFNDISKELDN